jgi:hypothetical protein
MKKTRINTLSEKIHPKFARRAGCKIIIGIPASSVPVGQKYLQNQGSPVPNSSIAKSGNRITIKTSKPYLKYLRKGQILNLGEGIL